VAGGWFDSVSCRNLGIHYKLSRSLTTLNSNNATDYRVRNAVAAHQQKQIETPTAGLQKISAQLELNKSAPQIRALVCPGLD
jgi:hypothetical protein